MVTVHTYQIFGKYLVCTSCKHQSRLPDKFVATHTQLCATDYDLGALTQREYEIIRELATGKNVKEIATALNSAISTVESHKYNIYKKLNIHSISDLTRFVIFIDIKLALKNAQVSEELATTILNAVITPK